MCPWRARTRNATSCLPAATPTPLRMPRTPSGRSQLPPVLIPFSCSPSRSAPRARTEPPPPTPIAAATVLPSPRRRAKKPRLVPLFLLTKTEGAGSPGCRQLRRSPPRPPRIAAVDSSPSGLPRDRRASLRDRGEPPVISPLTLPPFGCRSRRPLAYRSRRRTGSSPAKPR